MADFKKAELDLAAKNEVIANCIPENAVQIGNYEYAVPTQGADGLVHYVGITFAAKNTKDTKTTKAFDPDVAVEKWHNELDEAANKAKAIADARAAKKAEKESKGA